MIRKTVNSYSESKDLTDDSLNIYMPTSYNDIISKCRLDGYRVPDLSISDDTAVVDYRFICKTDDLELKYVLTIYKSDDEVMKKEFNNKDECDAYYDKLMKKIEEYNMDIKNEIKNIDKSTYKDSSNSLNGFLGGLKIKNNLKI